LTRGRSLVLGPTERVLKQPLRINAAHGTPPVACLIDYADVALFTELGAEFQAK
jgi:hypothetical protein